MGALSGFAVLSRRRLLAGILGLGGIALMGGGGLAALRGFAPGVGGLRLLSAHEYRTLTALAHALFPEGGAFPLGARSLDLARDFDGFLADQPDYERSDLQKALLLLEYGPVLFERRAVTFSRLPEDARRQHFEGWAASDDLVRRQVTVAFRKFLGVVFYDRPEAWRHIGYEGPLWQEGGPR